MVVGRLVFKLQNQAYIRRNGTKGNFHVRHGLEIYGVLKPFNTGMAGTYPEGLPEASTTRISRIGGNLQQAIPFIENHPHTRVQRRPLDLPPNLASIPVKKIRLIKHDDSPTRIKREHLQIWTSPNKGAPVRTLTLEGLSLEDQFILVTTDFEDKEGDFRNTAMAMVEAYGPGLARRARSILKSKNSGWVGSIG